MLLLERFFPGGGWIEIFAIGLYGALVTYHMQDPGKVQRWRKYSWFAFSVVFFSQMVLGLLVSDRFLMTGKLHLPVPMMIMAGPIYRGHISVMTILFLSTVVLSGPAWCSHLCYFGAIDNLAASGKTKRSPIRNKWALKSTVALLVIFSAIILRVIACACADCHSACRWIRSGRAGTDPGYIQKGGPDGTLYRFLPHRNSGESHPICESFPHAYR